MAARVLGQTKWSTWEALAIALAVVHGSLLLTRPSIPLVAIGLWWNANTISHHFVHRPFFRTRRQNASFSCYLSLLLGFPQSVWRARHLAHHLESEGRRQRHDLRLAPFDLGAVIVLWGALLVFAPSFVLKVYLPGFLTGLALCYLQGHYEHAQGTISHYGWLYNFLLFNDGYHVEHHARPGANWRELPRLRSVEARASRWPALLRWLECVNLCTLERLVLRSRLLQRFVIDRHECPMKQLLAGAPTGSRVGIVGGGLFPRTAIILKRLLPQSTLVLIDMNADHLRVALEFVGSEVETINERFDAGSAGSFDLLVIPLAFEGDRNALYRRPPAPVVLVHDWIWRRRGSSQIVSWLLLKRMNVVKR